MSFRKRIKDEECMVEHDFDHDHDRVKKFPCCEVTVKCFGPKKKHDHDDCDDKWDHKDPNCVVTVKCFCPKKKDHHRMDDCDD